MKDEFLTQMEVDYASQSFIFTGDSPDGASKYRYVQPWKLTTGAGYIHKYGLVSVEYELSDASNSKFKLSQNDANAKAYENYVNNLIKEKYGLFHTIKAGVEFKYDPIRIRGGIQYRTSPFKNAAAPSNINTSSLTFLRRIWLQRQTFFCRYCLRTNQL
jgi:long-subunit fatty acid transport protein